MYSQKRVVASPKFKMLVAHLSKSSDPSKGEEGNPTPLRQAFETQVITTSLGNGVLANVKEAEVILKIKVETKDFGNDNIGNPPPFRPQDEIQILANDTFSLDRVRALKAGTHFGRGEGGGAGNLNDIASDLALVLNDAIVGISASVDPQNANHVLVKSSGVLDRVFIKVYSLSYLLIGGAPPFILEDKDGNVLYNPANAEGGSFVHLIPNKSFSPMGIS